MKYYVVSLLKKENSYDEKYIELNTEDLEMALKMASNMFFGLSAIEKDHLITFDLTYVDDKYYTINDLLKDGYEPLKEFIWTRRDKRSMYEYLTVCTRDDLSILPSDSRIGMPRILRTDEKRKIGEISSPVQFKGMVEFKIIDTVY